MQQINISIIAVVFSSCFFIDHITECDKINYITYLVKKLNPGNIVNKIDLFDKYPWYKDRKRKNETMGMRVAWMDG